MPIIKEDKILIKNLFTMLREFHSKGGTYALSRSCCKSCGLLSWLTVIPAVADDAVLIQLIILILFSVYKLVLHTKMSRREIIFTHLIIRTYCLHKIINTGC